MSKSLEVFKTSLHSGPYVSSTVIDWEYRTSLIEEGKKLAKKLKAYKMKPPQANYLKASVILLTEGGLEAKRVDRGGSRSGSHRWSANINQDKIPIHIILEAVEDGRKRLGDLADKIQSIKVRFSRDIAELSFTGIDTTIEHVLITELRKKKERELVDIISKYVRPVPGSDITLYISEIKLRCYTQGGYKSSSQVRPELRVSFDQNDFELLSGFDKIKIHLSDIMSRSFGITE